MLGDARSVTLVNWTDCEVVYDPALVDGLKLSMGSLGSAVAGTLRPLEATVWSSE